jgi:hypothetical protein
MAKIKAPWTEDQVQALNRWQKFGYVHEFTCPNDGGALHATLTGWVCTQCDYVQDWAHDFMTKPTPDSKEAWKT